MKKYLITAALSLGLAVSAHAASFTFDGDIEYHNDVVEIAFTLDTAATDVSVWTDSFMSRTNFDPITAVWMSDGSDYAQIGQNDDDDTIATGQTFYDSGLEFDSLAAGDYLFTIATYANFANGSYLSGGFQYDGATPIPLASWQQPANNYNMGSYYRVHLDGVDDATNNTEPVPEPCTMLLMGTGLAGLIGLRKRQAKK